MKQNKILILMVALAVVFTISATVSASCLTDTEQSNIRTMATTGGANPDIIVNLYERLCNGDYINTTLTNFNASITAQVNNVLNQSTLSDTLHQVAQAINSSNIANNNSLNINNLIAESEARTNARMDNQSADLSNQFISFRSDINNIVTTKQDNSLSTNRIILIILGVIVAGGAIWYFTRKKPISYPNIRSAPVDMRDYKFPDEQQSDTRKVEPVSRKTVKRTGR